MYRYVCIYIYIYNAVRSWRAPREILGHMTLQTPLPAGPGWAHGSRLTPIVRTGVCEQVLLSHEPSLRFSDASWLGLRLTPIGKGQRGSALVGSLQSSCSLTWSAPHASSQQPFHSMMCSKRQLQVAVPWQEMFQSPFQNSRSMAWDLPNTSSEWQFHGARYSSWQFPVSSSMARDLPNSSSESAVLWHENFRIAIRPKSSY